MVGLVDGILKFISSLLLNWFWEWMDNAIKFETGSVKSVGLFRLGSLEFWLEWIDKGSKLFSNERNKI